MADIKFSALTAGSALAGTEKIPMVQSSSGVHTTPADIKTYLDTYYDTLKTRWDIRWDTYAGYGSSGTKIPYFTNKNKDTSSGGITIVNNSTDGLKLTITTAGVYAIVFCWNYSGIMDGGISLNASAVTTNIGSLAAAERLVMDDSVSGSNGSCAWTGNLSVNDIIRPHTSGSAGATAAQWGFSIAKIG